MKKASYFTVFTLVLSGFCWLGLPWWWVAVVGGLAGLIFQNKPWANFGLGFAAGTLLWSGLAAWLNLQNGGMLAGRIGQIFQGLSATQLIYATGAIGGLLTGMGALTGSLLRLVFERKKKRKYFA